MRNVLDCINVFIPLLSTEYELVLGKKGVSVILRISFDKKDCFHLMENNMESRNLFLFLSNDEGDNYFCRSFFQRKRWIIQKIKHRGHFFIRKRLIYQPE